MKSKLYEISQENFETIKKYFDITNLKVKNYYNNILKYKQYTSEYCSKIKQLFEKTASNENLELYEIIQIDYGLANKEIKNKILSSKEIYEKKINVSPIINCIEKINSFFKEYIQYLELFINTLEIPLKNLNQCIEVTYNEINSIKTNHNIKQKNFILNYCQYDSLNKDLIKLYDKVETKLINYCIEKKNIKMKKQDIPKLEKQLNLLLTNKIQEENKIIDSYKLLDNYEVIFK